MVSGLWANPNYDDDKGTRSDRLKAIEESFDEAIGVVYGEVLEEEIDPDDPFFSAMSVPEIDQDTKALLEAERERHSLTVRVEVDQG